MEFYFLDFVKNMIKKNNIGVCIWLMLNTIFVSLILGDCFGGGVSGISLGFLVYIIILAVSLSPFGEFILRFQNNCKPISRIDYKERLEPLFREVYEKVKRSNPEIPDDVKLYIVEDEDDPNAFATGRRTVCVTKGLLRYPDRYIKAVLAHEFGHLVHKDTDAILIIAVGNLIVNIFFFICRVFTKILTTMIVILFGFVSKSAVLTISAWIYKIFIDFLLITLMGIWTRIGVLLCLYSSRKNENKADEFSMKLGFGIELCEFLDGLGASHARGLWAALNSSHPSNDSRIAYLQELGCAYRKQW